jgi:hypothetical protein
LVMTSVGAPGTGELAPTPSASTTRPSVTLATSGAASGNECGAETGLNELDHRPLGHRNTRPSAEPTVPATKTALEAGHPAK